MSDVRYHVNPGTGESGLCGATQKPCPHGGASGNENHYATEAEARAAGEAMLAQRHGTFAAKRATKRPSRVSVKSVDATTSEFAGVPMSRSEALLRQQMVNMAQDFVGHRAALGDLKVNPGKGDDARAQDVLHNAIEFARSRGNIHLAEKLAKAQVLPTSAIESPDGNIKFYTEDLIERDTAVKTVKDGREEILASITRVAQEAPTGKYQVKTAAGSFNLTVSDDGINEAALARLTPAQRQAISTPRSVIDIDLAREHLDGDELRQVISQTQVLDYLSGSPRDIGQKKVRVRTEFGGADATAKVNDGLSAMADLYGDARDTFGKSYKDMTTERDAMAVQTKAAAVMAGRHMNTVVPGRSRKNALIVTGRDSIDRDLATKILSPEKLARITKVTHVPSKTAAAKVLTPEQMGTIFNARKVSLRVMEP